jgi:hypothetical protein
VTRSPELRPGVHTVTFTWPGCQHGGRDVLVGRMVKVGLQGDF